MALERGLAAPRTGCPPAGMEFPHAKDPPNPPLARAERAATRGPLMAAQLRLLIVEDSEDDALLVRRELERGDFELTMRRVESADSMRAALAEADWDIVIADFN